VKVIIDTHCWLWSLLDPQRLSPSSRALIADGTTAIYLSAASAWEIAIKSSLGKLKLPEAPELFVPSRMVLQSVQALPISQAHALRVGVLPPHHRDPFDRLLVAQAQLEEVALLTADPALRAYDVEIIWAGGEAD
jgi:PIN domain nuclease of toxin-antitoxin system